MLAAYLTQRSGPAASPSPNTGPAFTANALPPLRAPPMLHNVTDLDVRLVRLFLAVTQAGGVSAAQVALNIGQSTISTQLAHLEARLGFRLCERGRSGFRLTAKGERFKALAIKLLVSIDEFGAAARHMDRQLVGTLAIGLIGHNPVAENARLSDAIARFRGRSEAVRFDISIRPPGEMEERLLSDDLQLGIGYFWHRVPTLVYTPLFIERQVACCGRAHPLFANAGALGPEPMFEHEWAWRSYPVPEAQPGLMPRRVTAVADNMEAVAVLIMSGQHLGFLPQHLAEPYRQQGLLALLNPATLSYDVPFHLVTRRRGRSELVLAFVEDLRAVYLGA